MQKLTLITLAIIMTILSSCSDDETSATETGILSQQEEEDLKFSREEEKLARDVYLFSFDKYGNAIFNNIAKSEQQHMDQVLILLNNYQISDPASSEMGVFSNHELQDLYNELTTKSNISLIDALEVGAIIEDLDINDLNILESRTTKSDLLNVYTSLECGSRNHLRSYIGQLELNNVGYSPEFISTADFNEIINSTKEQCGR